MDYPIKEEGKFKYIESGGGEHNLLLLHGLLGALSNFEGIVAHFAKTHNVIIPILPIFDLPIREVSVSGLVDYVIQFVEYKNLEDVHVLGNSLGGHISLLYALARPEKIASVILTGSSGLFESAMGSTFPKRGNYEYIKKKTEDTFFNKEIATKELVDEIFGVVNDRNKAIRVIATAKSAIRHNLSDKLHQINSPTLLIWGSQDQVTPPFVAQKFNELIKGSRLVFMDNCGHAPMMELPAQFNLHLENFLKEVAANTVGSSSSRQS